jgi:hypothetical protein
MRDVRDFCRSKSLDAAKALANIIDDVVTEEDGRVRSREGGRIVVVAAQTLLTWAFGKPPDYDPSQDRAPIEIDTSILSPEERKMMLSVLRQGLLKQIDAEPDPSEASRVPRQEGGKARIGVCF